MIPQFQVFKDRGKQWRFRLRAANGKIVLASEAYTSKRNASAGIKSIFKCVEDAEVIYLD